jgi:hypothetical protein
MEIVADLDPAEVSLASHFQEYTYGLLTGAIDIFVGGHSLRSARSSIRIDLIGVSCPAQQCGRAPANGGRL